MLDKNLIVYETMVTPPPERYPMSHAPYLTELGGGAVLLTWFAGSREWAKDVHVMSARYDADKGAWGEIGSLITDVGYSLGNSVTLIDPMGRLHAWYVRTKGYWSEGEVVRQIHPGADAPPESKSLLPLPVGWLIRGRPVLRGNTVYLPIYHETELSSCVWTQDLAAGEGKMGEQITAEGGLIHPTLVDVGGNEFRCYFRNPRTPNRIHGAYSMNRGGSWSRPLPSDLPNPNSGFDVALIRKDTLVCVYNDSPTKRYPLSIAISTNMGMNWRKLGDLETEQGEFSYPSLLASGNRLHLAYTHDRSAIRFLTLDKEALGNE